MGTQPLSAEQEVCYQRDVAPFLRDHLRADFAEFGRDGATEFLTGLEERWGRDEGGPEAARFDVLRRVTCSDLAGLAILDMAAGCGSFVLQGLRRGHDAWGLEPELWKHELVRRKVRCFGHPEDWPDRIKRGVGEDLPFADATFDLVDSWQTLEHVRDESACLREFFRVLRPGGAAVVHIPSYASFYEGHYGMPWLPYLGGDAARAWVRLLHRPAEGVSVFHTITGRSLARKAGAAGFAVLDYEVLRFLQRLRRRAWAPSGRLLRGVAVDAFRVKRLAGQARRAFAAERAVRLVLLKPPLMEGVAGAFVADACPRAAASRAAATGAHLSVSRAGPRCTAP